MHSSPDQIGSASARVHGDPLLQRTGRAFARTEAFPRAIACVAVVAAGWLSAGCFAQIDEARERARAAADASDGLDLDVIGPSVDAEGPSDVLDPGDVVDIGFDVDDAGGDTSDGSGDAGDAVGFDVVRPPVPFEEIVALFETQCTPCHIDRVSGGLSLLAGPQLHERLLSPAVQLPSMVRVSPGEPAASYLWLKLEGTHAEAGGLGEPMPLGGTLSAQQLGQLRRWIEEGATADE